MVSELGIRELNGGKVTGSPQAGYKLSLMENSGENYCLAQLDDYMHLSRRGFYHQSPCHFRITARVSGRGLKGTWGFGFWNDPFGLPIGGGGFRKRLPALPNAVWFFYGSAKNYISFHDHQSATGFHAGSFQSPCVPSILSLLSLPGLPFLLLPVTARSIRKILQLWIRESFYPLALDPKDWHTYSIDWETDQVRFFVDGQTLFQTPLSPRGKLGLVIWMDNQYMRFDPAGHVGYGVENIRRPQWLEIRDVFLSSPFLGV